MDPRSIQRLLTAAGYYNGAIDGDFGPKSMLAVEKILQRNKPGALKWSTKRQRIAAAQVVLNAAGYDAGTIDGYWLTGGTTHEALNAWDIFTTTEKREILPGRDLSKPTITPAPSGKIKWPRQAQVPTFFGKAGGPQCTAGKAVLPFPFRIAWNKAQKVKQFSCHEKVADAFTSIFTEAAAHYGESRMRALGLDLFGGCYNYRPMRGGTSLSMHAYGIACDLDPENNQLRWTKARATFARSEYDAFWKIVEAHGGLSLGRARDYDWMHFQFANL